MEGSSGAPAAADGAAAALCLVPGCVFEYTRLAALQARGAFFLLGLSLCLCFICANDFPVLLLAAARSEPPSAASPACAAAALGAGAIGRNSLAPAAASREASARRRRRGAHDDVRPARPPPAR